MFAVLCVACLGAASLFVFFAVLGTVSPTEVLWLGVVLAVLLAMVALHSLMVRRNLHKHGNQEFFRSLNRLRERRGF